MVENKLHDEFGYLDAHMSSECKLVLVFLLKNANEKGVFGTRRDEICKGTNLSHLKVEHALKKLEDRDFIIHILANFMDGYDLIKLSDGYYELIGVVKKKNRSRDPFGYLDSYMSLECKLVLVFLLENSNGKGVIGTRRDEICKGTNLSHLKVEHTLKKLQDRDFITHMLPSFMDGYDIMQLSDGYYDLLHKETEKNWGIYPYNNNCGVIK